MMKERTISDEGAEDGGGDDSLAFQLYSFIYPDSATQRKIKKYLFSITRLMISKIF